MWKLFKLILAILTLGLSLFITGPVFAKKKSVRSPYDENYFTNKLIDEHPFTKGCDIGRKFKADLFRGSYVIEVDWESKMYEALGQALAYSFVCKKKPAIVILDDINRKVNFHKFLDIFKHYKVKVWIVEVDKSNGTIISVK